MWLFSEDAVWGRGRKHLFVLGQCLDIRRFFFPFFLSKVMLLCWRFTQIWGIELIPVDHSLSFSRTKQCLKDPSSFFYVFPFSFCHYIIMFLNYGCQHYIILMLFSVSINVSWSCLKSSSSGVWFWIRCSFCVWYFWVDKKCNLCGKYCNL